MTPLFPGWHLPTLRKKPKTALQKIIENNKIIQRQSITHLNVLLSQYIPRNIFKNISQNAFTRQRIFSLENTFWGFFFQILNPDGGCQSVVNQLRTQTVQKNGITPSQSTSAYCQARKKIPTELLRSIFDSFSLSATKINRPSLANRRVVVADGTGVSMPDTVANQADYPQPRGQKIGCGFPQSRICACFDLYSGIALSYQVGNKKSSELPLLRKQFHIFKKDDIFLGDKGFVCYFDMITLKSKGVDSIIGLAKRKPVKTQDANEILGKDDLLITWNRTPRNRTISDLSEWRKLPDSIVLRQVKVHIDIPGYRPKDFYIVTTLIDPVKYPAEDIKEIYLKRWNVELYFRDLKTTLGMDILRCKSPDMVEKEILMNFIVFNMLKRLSYDSIKESDSDPDDVSFKSCQQVLLGYVSINEDKTKVNLLPQMLKIIAENLILKRPQRVEPRVVKRRPKPFKLMMKPRSELKLDLVRESHPKMA
jgi:hypothetical protein